MLRRLEKLHASPEKDAGWLEQVRPLWEAYLARLQVHRDRGVEDPELERYRWMLEELRVSLFAQELGTSFPVSMKRLRQQWGQVR